MINHPIQPLIRDDQGILRFKKNKIISYLLEICPKDLNELTTDSKKLGFSTEDWEQFYQLLGYSLNGYSDIDIVSKETISIAEEAYKRGATEEEAEIICLNAKIEAMQDLIKKLNDLCD